MVGVAVMIVGFQAGCVRDEHRRDTAERAVEEMCADGRIVDPKICDDFTPR